MKLLWNVDVNQSYRINPKGRKSAEWYLEGVPGDQKLEGEFTNKSTGKISKVVLRIR